MGRKEKSNIIKTNNTTRRNKSEGTGEGKKMKKYRDRIKQYRQNRTFQKNERKFYLGVGGECSRTCQQMDEKEAKQFWSKIWERKNITEKPKG